MPRQHGRKPAPRPLPQPIAWLAALGLPLSPEGLAFTILILVIGFGPLLLFLRLEPSGWLALLLKAWGPIAVSLIFAALILFYGTRYRQQTGWQIWQLRVLSTGLVLFGLVTGWLIALD